MAPDKKDLFFLFYMIKLNKNQGGNTLMNTSRKRIISFFMIFIMTICLLPMANVYAAKGDLGEGYNVNNIDFTFSTVDGEQVSSNSNGKIKVIVFARTNGNCQNSNGVMKSVCGVGWSTSSDIDTLIVDIDQRDAASVKESSISYDPCMVKFCYDETNASADMMWQYIGNTRGRVNSIILPVTVIIDKNNKVQYCITGYISAVDLYEYIEPLLNGEGNQEEEDVIVGKDQIKVYTEGYYDYDSTEEVFKLTNDARVGEGKAKLVMDEKLTEIAMHRAAEQALLYSHTRPTGIKWHSLLTGKYLYGAGENIAYGQSNASTVTTAWLNSEGHRANIMNSDFTSMGVGSFIHNGTRFWVQIFSSYSESSYTDKEGVSKSVVLDAIPQNVGDFILDVYNSRLNVGETTSVYMKLNNLGSASQLMVKADNVVLKSSDEAIATIDSNGNITAVSAGKVKITAILDETLVAKCDLSVIAETPSPTESPIEIENVFGDVDGNMKVDAADALEVLKYAARLRDLSEKEFFNADVTKSNSVDASDALKILKYAARIIDSLE